MENDITVDIPKQLIDYLELESDICSLKVLTDEQKEFLREKFDIRLSTTGIYYSEEVLIFTNAAVHARWNYYAGFEYIKNFDLIDIKSKRVYLAIYDCNSGEKVEEILETLNNL